MSLRSRLRFLRQNDPPTGHWPSEDGQSQSIQWLFEANHLYVQGRFQRLEQNDYVSSDEESRRLYYRTAAAFMVVVIAGAGAFLAIHGTRHRSSVREAEANHSEAKALPAPALATIALPKPPSPVKSVVVPALRPAPQPETVVVATADPAPSPKVAAPAPSPADTEKTAIPQAATRSGAGSTPMTGGVAAAGPTDRSSLVEQAAALQIPSSGTGFPAPAAEPNLVYPPAPANQASVMRPPAKLAAAVAVPRKFSLPAAKPFKVQLSFTAGESRLGAAFARQLQQEGYQVTSAVIPVARGRWPGVAFFFRSDREKARLIARQLAAVTGRHEHARLSPRHPYPKPGVVEESLIDAVGTHAGRADR